MKDEPEITIGKTIMGDRMISYNGGITWAKVDIMDLALTGQVEALEAIQAAQEQGETFKLKEFQSVATDAKLVSRHHRG